MSKDDVGPTQQKLGPRIREALKGLLDRVREETEELAGLLKPQPKLQPQPIPVRSPLHRRIR